VDQSNDRLIVVNYVKRVDFSRVFMV